MFPVMWLEEVYILQFRKYLLPSSFIKMILCFLFTKLSKNFGHCFNIFLSVGNRRIDATDQTLDVFGDDFCRSCMSTDDLWIHLLRQLSYNSGLCQRLQVSGFYKKKHRNWNEKSAET